VIRAFRFGNPSKSSIVISIEPWTDELTIPPGSVLTLHCQYEDRDDPPTIEAHDWGIWFCPECIDYTADLDGKSITV